MKAKFTPGPWEGQAERSGPNHWNEGTFARIEGSGKLIASFDASYEEYPETLEEVRANVILMANAPELLEALQRLNEQCDRLRLPGQRETEAEKNAKAVIAKVLGESK